ncbi:methionine synthase reductase-like [Panulirus ornatus]|uniref:methionine synthase reductase-like n=1 Tax=Panulirus ornatus TaxID=150431 RepID=UPI003A8BD382
MRGGRRLNPADILLLYASQNGNSKAIAEDLFEQCEANDLPCELKCCSEIDKGFHLEKTKCMVLVGATTGDGDPPDTARKLWRHLHKKDQPNNTLSHLSYTVLGLGDTNYTNFCNFGKTVDQKLQALGGNRFYDCGWADDGTGLEIVVEPWIEGLLPALKNHLSKRRNLEENLSNSGTFMDQNTSVEDSSKVKNKNENDKILDNRLTDDITRVISTNEQSETLFVRENNLGVSSSLLMVNESILDTTHVALKKVENQEKEKGVDVISVISAKYNINIISQEEIHSLSVKSCAFPVDAKLTLPLQPLSYLTIKYLNTSYNGDTQSAAPLPSAVSEVVQVCVASVRKLTRHDAVKTAMEVTLKLPSNTDEFVYEPGDSVGILVKNPKHEVEILMNLLEITEIADKSCEISVASQTRKKSATVPAFIPRKSSLRHILENCMDIRSVPKKPLIRALLEYTSNPSEKRRLQEFVSKEGATEYSKHVREMNLTTLDLLIIFQSCKPPVTTLLEHLPRLQPRAYSIISSPLVDSKNISFAFNVVDIPKENTVTFARKGICTGWLASVYDEHKVDNKNLNQALDDLSLADTLNTHACIYLRCNQSFRLPQNIENPIVLVGPGTGVAPFVGFLRHREVIKNTEPSITFGESWLFFGCRHKERDFLYREELEKFQENKILNHLIVSFSRDGTSHDGPKYVQDNILIHGTVLASLLVNKNAVVYVCGDAQNMAKEVFEAFVTVIQVHMNQTEVDARKFMAQMQIEKRYLQDVWT